jgi:hypothetical protein
MRPSDNHSTVRRGGQAASYLAGWSDADIAVSFTVEMRDPVEVDIRREDDSGTPAGFRDPSGFARLNGYASTLALAFHPVIYFRFGGIPSTSLRER